MTPSAVGVILMVLLARFVIKWLVAARLIEDRSPKIVLIIASFLARVTTSHVDSDPRKKGDPGWIKSSCRLGVAIPMAWVLRDYKGWGVELEAREKAAEVLRNLSAYRILNNSDVREALLAGLRESSAMLCDLCWECIENSLESGSQDVEIFKFKDEVATIASLFRIEDCDTSKTLAILFRGIENKASAIHDLCLACILNMTKVNSKRYLYEEPYSSRIISAAAAISPSDPAYQQWLVRGLSLNRDIKEQTFKFIISSLTDPGTIQEVINDPLRSAMLKVAQGRMEIDQNCLNGLRAGMLAERSDLREFTLECLRSLCNNDGGVALVNRRSIRKSSLIRLIISLAQTSTARLNERNGALEILIIFSHDTATLEDMVYHVDFYNVATSIIANETGKQLSIIGKAAFVLLCKLLRIGSHRQRFRDHSAVLPQVYYWSLHADSLTRQALIAEFLTLPRSVMNGGFQPINYDICYAVIEATHARYPHDLRVGALKYLSAVGSRRILETHPRLLGEVIWSASSKRDDGDVQATLSIILRDFGLNQKRIHDCQILWILLLPGVVRKSSSPLRFLSKDIIRLVSVAM